MKFWVGVTDNTWFRFLSRANPDEVNFWQPRGQATYAELEPGSLFLFKLKSPNNHIAGGAYFIKSTSLPLSVAWEAFGIKNGASSRLEFESLIRRLIPEIEPDASIGCTVLSDPFFWSQEDWIPVSSSWGRSIVRGRYYDLATAQGSELWTNVQNRLEHGSRVVREVLSRYGEPILVKPRLGQGGFRVVVTDAYERRCAITGETTLPVLEAAHILPFAESGPHDIQNGLLLRSDFHKLFDLGLISVTPELRVEVSKRIKEEWFNGKAYNALHGQLLKNIPRHLEQRPHPTYLQWHYEKCFRP